MTLGLKLLVAFATAAFVISLAGAASAESRQVRPLPAAEAPAAAPRQFFATKGLQPLTAEIEQALKPKDSFKECDSCPEMVVVPKGSFIMGTPITEVDRAKGEDPQHRVSFARPFAVGRFTISFDEWDACLADGGCDGNKGDDHGFGRGRMPAQGVDSKGPAVVDSYAPNPFGLYQVHGNVWEWTEDCFNKRCTEDTPIDGAPWLEGDCTKHMVRGGLWNWSADKSRSGYRDDQYFGNGHSFRVVRTLNVQP